MSSALELVLTAFAAGSLLGGFVAGLRVLGRG